MEEYPILVRAEVQHPKVCLLSCEAAISDAFVGVPAKTEVSLMNMTMLPTRFAWAEMEGKMMKMMTTMMNMNMKIIMLPTRFAWAEMEDKMMMMMDDE